MSSLNFKHFFFEHRKKTLSNPNIIQIVHLKAGLNISMKKKTWIDSLLCDGYIVFAKKNNIPLLIYKNVFTLLNKGIFIQLMCSGSCLCLNKLTEYVMAHSSPLGLILILPKLVKTDVFIISWEQNEKENVKLFGA